MIGDEQRKDEWAVHPMVEKAAKLIKGKSEELTKIVETINEIQNKIRESQKEIQDLTTKAMRLDGAIEALNELKAE